MPEDILIFRHSELNEYTTAVTGRQLNTFFISVNIRSRSPSVKLEPEGRHNPSLNNFSEVPSP